MNILYSILYAALTVFLALAPFGVLLWLKRSKKKVEFWQLISAYLFSLVAFTLMFGFLSLREDIHEAVFYLYYLYEVFYLVSPFIFRKLIKQPASVPGAIVLFFALFGLGLVAMFLLLTNFGFGGLVI